MPNGFAYLALFAFLPFGICLFMVFRPPLAAVLVFLLSWMFLPEATELDLPGVPGIGKQEVAALACLFGVMLRGRRALWVARPLRGPEALLLLVFIGHIGTSLTNTDIVHPVPAVTLPGLSIYESVSISFQDGLRYLLPFLLARALFRTAKDLRLLLTAIAVAGVAYTPFLFIELMMSPQMHNWIYGFAQHDFNQTVRGGGYRPMVFMPHGLSVGLFMSWATMSAVTLWKARKNVFGVSAPFVALYDFGWLVAVKSLGAMIYSLIGAPIVVFLKPRAGARVAMIIATIVMSYPIWRATPYFPQQGIIATATSIAGAERAQSLQFRFDMEALLIAHASERPVFGWGRFQRNMLFSEWSGRTNSVSDGHWIVIYSSRGAWGFITLFAFLLAPLVVLRKRLRRIEAADERAMLGGLGLMVAVGALDLLPNAMFNVFLVFLCGALWGAARSLSLVVPQEPFADMPEAPTPRPFT